MNRFQPNINILLQAFYSIEQVDHVCEKCNNSKANFINVISSLPRILIVHLKRFKVDYETQAYQKDNASIVIDQSINLGNFVIFLFSFFFFFFPFFFHFFSIFFIKQKQKK